MVQGGEQDDSMPQWLNFTFKKKSKVILQNITLQEAIIKSPRRVKRARMIHLSRMDSGDIIVDIATPVQDVEGSSQATPRYQVSKVNLGKLTKWGEIDTLVAATSTVRTRMEKEYKTKA